MCKDKGMAHKHPLVFGRFAWIFVIVIAAMLAGPGHLHAQDDDLPAACKEAAKLD